MGIFTIPDTDLSCLALIHVLLVQSDALHVKRYEEWLAWNNSKMKSDWEKNLEMKFCYFLVQ